MTVYVVIADDGESERISEVFLRREDAEAFVHYWDSRQRLEPYRNPYTYWEVEAWEVVEAWSPPKGGEA